MNKRFLRTTALSLFMLFVVNTVNAQSHGAEKIGSYLTQEMSFLNMTPTQGEEVFQINLLAAGHVETLDRESHAQNNTQAENLAAFASILKQRNLALQEILSPIQFELFLENKIARAAIFRAVVMAKMLDLSQDQLAPVLDINQTVVENVRTELDTYFSTDSNRGRKKAQRKLRKALKKTDQAFDEVLSPLQKTIYHEKADILRNVISGEYGIKDSF
jgi:hypothetical protein